MVYRMPDEDFSLRKVKEDVLFDGLKEEIARVIRTFKGFETVECDKLMLNVEYTSRRDTFGKDRNFYHHMVLDFSVRNNCCWYDFNLYLDPFEVKVAPRVYEAELIEDEGLSSCYFNFMVNSFPESNYKSKREEYFKKAKLLQEVDEELLSL